jgi:hypothetical protein
VDKQADILTFGKASKEAILREFAPTSLIQLRESQTAIPMLAKDEVAVRDIEAILPTLPTMHEIHRADARELNS